MSRDFLPTSIFSMLLLLLVVAGTISSTNGAIRVYEDVHFQGATRTLPPFKACLDLTSSWEDRISSVSTEGGCIILCEHKRCLGQCKKFYGGTLGSQDFTLLQLNDKISSYKNCESPNENEIRA